MIANDKIKDDTRVNSLPNDKNLDVTKVVAFTNEIIKVAKMTISSFGRLENHCGKRRKCWLPAFSPIPTVFSKAFLFRIVKSRDCAVQS